MKLIRTSELTSDLEQELTLLKEHCEAHAMQTYSFQPGEIDPELTYRYYLIYEGNLLISALIVSLVPDSDSPFFDFFAMTEPAWQRQGFFSDLFEEMLDDLENEFPDTAISSDLFLDSKTLLPGFLESFGYEETSREYLMEIPAAASPSSVLSLKATKDYDLLSSCYSKIFQVSEEQADLAFDGLKEFETWYLIQLEKETVGIVLLMMEENGCYLCNFGILPEHRRKHYAWQALYAIQNQIPETISLQVSSHNLPAFSLYQNYGFHITKEFLCYSQVF